MMRHLLTVLALLVLVTVGAAQTDKSNVLEFASMASVTGPFVGTANPIRGVSGGGLPWMISKGQGELRSNGDLEVHVRGLVLAAGPLAGTNPIPNFRALVSCQSIDSNGNPSVVNISTRFGNSGNGRDSHPVFSAEGVGSQLRAASKAYLN